MKAGERFRVRFAFGLLGGVPVFLAGWLGWVQVAQAGELARDKRAPLRLVAATADRQFQRDELVPAPRGTIVDRNGSVLALDCEVYDVRAQVVLPRKQKRSAEDSRAFVDELAHDFARAMVADSGLADRSASRVEYFEKFRAQLGAGFRVDEMPATGALAEGHPDVVDMRIAGAVDVLAVIEALREIGERRPSVTMHFLRSFQRKHPDRASTFGIVGHTDTRWETAPGTETPRLRAFGVCGLESFAVLEPDAATTRRFLQDGDGRPYFVAPIEETPKPNVLHSTLDIELQRAAVRELAVQAESGTRDAKASQAKWGSLVLVEMATGDVLAAASWHRGEVHPEASAFTPYQSLYEPGSIVKPLVFAYALEAGVLDWNHEFDCSPGSADYRERISSLGSRVVKDDHHCDVLTPHGILVNSSNIGATYVGLGLEREQWRDYMTFFGFGASLGLNMPHERTGGTDSRSFDPSIPLRSFRRNSAISFSFGYEMQVTAMHIARAYLRLFRGSGAQLRLCRGAEIDGRFHPAPAPPAANARLRPEVVDAVRAAMVDVVSDDPKATGSHLHARMLKEMGIDLHGVVAGKTGTAASRIGIPGRGKVDVRNASFVGFLPVEAPRWLAVCILQRDDSASFYGGSYAAPPAVRLLLQCESLADRRQRRQESQGGSGGQAQPASGTPGDSGWGRGLQRQSR